jgi:hypothetical protein
VSDWLINRSIGRVNFQEEGTVVDLMCFASKQICRRTSFDVADVTKASSQGKDNTFGEGAFTLHPAAVRSLRIVAALLKSTFQSTFLALLDNLAAKLLRPPSVCYYRTLTFDKDRALGIFRHCQIRVGVVSEQVRYLLVVDFEVGDADGGRCLCKPELISIGMCS